MTDPSIPLTVLFAADVESLRYRGILDHLTGAPSRFAVQLIDSDAALLEAAGIESSSICLIGEMEDGPTPIDLLRRLRSTGYSQPVIMLVSGKDDEAGSGMLDAGADDYLDEDEFDPRLVDRTIRYVLRSAQLRARAEFEASRSHSIVEHIPATVWEIWFRPDPSQGRLAWINGWLETTLGYTREEWLGSPDFWLTLVHPDDRERAREEAAAGLASDTDHIVSCRMISRTGQLFWVQSHVSIIHDEAGAQIGVRGVAIDITEQRRAEEKVAFQANLLSGVGQAVIAVDLEGLVIYWNRSAEEMYGWTCDEAIGRNLSTLVLSEATIEQGMEIMARMYEGERWSGEFTVRDRDGRSFPAFVSDAPIYDDRGSLIGIIGISTDITDLKNAERALREANEGLELRVAERTVEIQAAFSRVQQAYAQQKQFVSNASHDLRTPVTIVRAELDLLLWRTKDDQVTRESLENALAGLARLDRLAADLLLLSDVESDTGAISFARTGVTGIISEAISTVSANALQKGIAWRIDIDRTAEIYCDVDLMQRAVANLLDNAIRYSDREGAVTVTTHIGESDIVIRIADEGPGIPAEDLPRIWDSFYRGNLARSGYGSGLGLTIARSIVEAHNGHITVVSGMGVGTTFTVSIPLSPSDPSGGEKRVLDTHSIGSAHSISGIGNSRN